MARIRTIKPEFWTDEKIVQLPYHTRLLFIGMWNFADDFGYLPDEPDRIKMQIMPSDPIDAAIEIDLLIAIGLVARYYGEDGGSYLCIPHFSDHQKVDHPAKSKIFREGSRKFAIPSAARRAIAKKYGCPPGESVSAECYYCGAPGEIHWCKTTKGQPAAWVSFHHEIDHLISENTGGETDSGNFVLACRECNRSKGTKDFMVFLNESRESSRILAPEGKGREGKGREKEKTAATREQFQNCFDEKADRLKELYPHIDFEAESETCIAHYQGEAVKTDPYSIILKWFNRVPKPEVRAGLKTFEQIRIDSTKQGMVDFAEGAPDGRHPDKPDSLRLVHG